MSRSSEITITPLTDAFLVMLIIRGGRRWPSAMSSSAPRRRREAVKVEKAPVSRSPAVAQRLEIDLSKLSFVVSISAKARSP
jgi:hypothetical protein